MADQLSPIACDMTALSPEQRQRHGALSRQLAQATAEVKELPDGYAFRYASEEGTWLAAAEYVELERQCCPFFHFALEREPEGGPVWLRLTGGEGVKAFLASQIKQGA